MRIRVIALLLTLFSLNTISAQELSFVWEPFLHQWEEGVDPDELVALNGYVTWRLYAEIVGDVGDENLPEYFSSITGQGADCPGGLIPLEILFDPSVEMLAMNEDTCCLFQHPNGSAIGEQINESFCAFTPALCYDSWISCGASSSAEAIDPCNTVSSDQDWVGNFENCETQGVLINTCTGGGWFTLYNPANTTTQFDENNQLLIGQFTVAIGCELDGASMCLQYFIDGDQNQNNVICLEFDQPAACFNSPIFSSIENFSDTLACVGSDEGFVDFSFQGGSFDLEASLYDDNNNLIQGPISGTDPEGNSETFSNLSAGSYYILIEDNETVDIDGITPCQSTTEVFTIYEAPEPLGITPTVTTDVACAGQNEGVIELVISGGLMPYSEPTCSFPGYEVTQDSPDTFTFSMLDSTSGGIDFTVTDTLGCEVTVNVPQLGDLDDLVVDVDEVSDITCNGDDDGSIDITITSSGNPLITWTSSVGVADPNAEDLSDLGPGWYHFTVDDGTSCIYVADTIFIIEPDPLLITNAMASPIDCFGDCNSTVSYDSSGGTGAITETFIQGGGDTPNGEICAGIVGILIEDENGCSTTEENISVLQNNQILLNPSSTNVTCPNGNDGSICISPEGGEGTLVVTLDPLAEFDTVDSCFINLTAGSYEALIEDELGCSTTETIIITQPNPFIANYNVQNITCNGDCDGSIIGVGNITGGTAPYDFTIDNGISTQGNDSIVFEDLCPGEYLFSFEDADGCEFIEIDPIVITEPDALQILELVTTPAGCGGDNTATAEVTVTGGTLPIIPYWNNIESVLTDSMAFANDLLDGDNLISFVDGNGCTLDSLFFIEGLEELTIVINSSNVTCTGMCDGAQTVAFLGGVPPYESELPNIPQDGVCEGDYPVFVEDASGCTAMDTIRIEADSISNISYTVFTTPVSCWNTNDGTATVAATGGYGPLSYQWSDAAFQTTATAIGLVEDFYTVTITDTIGCTFTENVIIEPTVGCFLIANAITPNGDGFNDLWILGGIEYFPEAKVEVFNRWGQRVYESTGIYTPWDGKFNDERLPISDYYYVITFDPDAAPLTGSVTIKY